MPPRKQLVQPSPHLHFLASHSDLWTSRYEPKDIQDLPFHEVKKKPNDFFNVIGLTFRNNNSSNRLILVTGPYGSGKSTLVKCCCSIKNIDIIEFCPDDDTYGVSIPDRKEKKANFSYRDSVLVPSLALFLSRAQLVSIGPNQSHRKQILLLDNFEVPFGYFHEFLGVLREYNMSYGFKYPVIWIVDPTQEKYATDSYLGSFYRIQLNKVPPSVFKRVLKRIGEHEGISLKNDLIESLIADNVGDIRSLVNNFQFARDFNCGNYESLSFFQAVGEVLYKKKKRSEEDILSISHVNPIRFMNVLFENYLDFYTNLDEISISAEHFSMADTMVNIGWNDADLVEHGVTMSMRSVICHNVHSAPSTFHSLKQGYKSVVTIIESPNEPLLCWPTECIYMKPKDLESRVFSKDTSSYQYIKNKFNIPSKTIATDYEIEEEGKILDDDPIEDVDFC